MSYLTDEPRTELTILDVPALPTAVVARDGIPVAKMHELFDVAFGAVAGSVETAGPALALYRDRPTDTVSLEVGFPVAVPIEQHAVDGLDVVPSELPAGRVAVRTHVGPYEGLGEAWQAFVDDLVAARETPGMPFWEVYVTMPTPDTDPATLRTDLYVPLG